MTAEEPGKRNLDAGIELVLGELRDLRVEMRADRQRSDEERRQVDEAWRRERQQADEQRRQADEAWQRERRQADEAWQQERRRVDEQLKQDRAAADERLRQERVEFQQFLQEMRRESQEFREDSLRREAAAQRAFKDSFKQVHPVGLAIVRTLNRHTQILERIDRRLAGPGNGRRGRDNGRGR
ncbi:MAG TPA: hypothetical protein VK548_00960 [Candidatus Acidoferrum sp.]|nr:hypothetical protein [Candidatus Acidoferrum sp.]